MNYKAFLLSASLVFMLCVSCTQADESPINKLERILEEEAPFNISYKRVEINCPEKDSILYRLFHSDQNIRKGGGGNMVEIDEQNFSTLASLIDQCGWPKFDSSIYDVKTFEEWNIRSAMFLVLQHSGKYRMSKYYFNIKNDVEHNILDKGSLALYQDRLLLDYDLPQVYGTQIVYGELGKLWNPENVNKRRSAMELPPIEDYLWNYGLNFEKEIAKHKSE